MAIVNIIDRRKRPYRFMKINAIVEAAWHDNSCRDADPVTDRTGPDYEEYAGVSLEEAMCWALLCEGSVTLFLYDDGDGITEARPSSWEAARRQRSGEQP